MGFSYQYQLSTSLRRVEHRSVNAVTCKQDHDSKKVVSHEENNHENSASTGGGFVRSWKLNLRLTTRAEDSHATPNPCAIHFYSLLYVVHTYSVVVKMIIRILNFLRGRRHFSSSLKTGKVYRGSSVYTTCSTACKSSRQFL